MNIHSDRPSKKLDDKRYGLFVVKKKVGEAAYKLKLPATWRGVYLVFNKQYLTVAHPAIFPRQKLPLPQPAIEIEGEPEYEVEEILTSKKGPGGHVKYLV